ncbi:MAG: hypothetical protein ACK5QG_15720 [Bacteroidota bacterium]|jgi:hypothetical protein
MMSIEIILPVALGIGSLLWNYFQSRRLQKLEFEANTRRIVQKFQFEKEFEVYKELWVKLTDVKNAAEKLSFRSENFRENAKDLEVQYHLLKDFFERNKPFYPEQIFGEVKAILITLSSDSFWSEASDPESIQRRVQSQNSLAKQTDRVAEAIRSRIYLD